MTMNTSHLIPRILGFILLLMPLGANARNVVVPASYTVSEKTDCGTYCFRDSSGRELIDGVHGYAGWAVNHAEAWLGWSSKPSVNVDFDFGFTTRIKSISMGSTQDAPGSIVLPSVEVYQLLSGNWVLVGQLNVPVTSSNNRVHYDENRRAVIRLEGLEINSRYVRLTLKNNGQWIFVDEVAFVRPEIAGVDTDYPLHVADNFESYADPLPWDTLGDWVGHWYWDVITDPVNPDNRVLKYYDGIGSAYPSLYLGNAHWGDQELEFKFRWDGSSNPYYLFAASLRDTGEGNRYRLYARNHLGSGQMHLTVVRDGHSNTYANRVGEGNWEAWMANVLDDTQLGFAPADSTVLDRYAGTLTPNHWYKITFRAKKNQLQVFLDDKPLFDTVLDQLAVNPSGRIGLGLPGDGHVVVDDVRVYDLSQAASILSFTNSVTGNAGSATLTAGQPIALGWNAIDGESVTLYENDVAIAQASEGDITRTPTANTVYRLVALGSAAGEERVLGVVMMP